MGDLKWVSAARLADKYDSPLVRALCKGEYWELTRAMDEPQMLKETALEVLPHILDKKGPASSVLAWYKVVKLHAFEYSVQAAPAGPTNLDPDSVHMPLPGFEAAWHQAMSNSMARRFAVCPLSPFCAEAEMQMESAGLSCGQHTEFRLWLRGFEQRYRDTAPDFPL